MVAHTRGASRMSPEAKKAALASRRAAADRAAAKRADAKATRATKVAAAARKAAMEKAAKDKAAKAKPAKAKAAKAKPAKKAVKKRIPMARGSTPASRRNRFTKWRAESRNLKQSRSVSAVARELARRRGFSVAAGHRMMDKKVRSVMTRPGKGALGRGRVLIKDKSGRIRSVSEKNYKDGLKRNRPILTRDRFTNGARAGRISCAKRGTAPAVRADGRMVLCEKPRGLSRSLRLRAAAKPRVLSPNLKRWNNAVQDSIKRGDIAGIRDLKDPIHVALVFKNGVRSGRLTTTAFDKWFAMRPRDVKSAIRRANMAPRGQDV